MLSRRCAGVISTDPDCRRRRELFFLDEDDLLLLLLLLLRARFALSPPPPLPLWRGVAPGVPPPPTTNDDAGRRRSDAVRSRLRRCFSRASASSLIASFSRAPDERIAKLVPCERSARFNGVMLAASRRMSGVPSTCLLYTSPSPRDRG